MNRIKNEATNHFCNKISIDRTACQKIEIENCVAAKLSFSNEKKNGKKADSIMHFCEG